MADKLTLARPYAKAIFDIACVGEDYDRWSYVLSVLSFLVADKRVANLLRNKTLSSSDLSEFFSKVCGADFNTEEHNLIHVLACAGRLNVVSYIAILYEQFKAVALKTLKVELISAVALSEQQKIQFSQMLKNYFLRTIELDCHVDAHLIGGYVVRAGNQIIDGSLRGNLVKLKNIMGGR